MLKKENRISHEKDFDQVFKLGSSFYCKTIGIKVLNNDLGLSRLGVIVSTKVSKKAVVRNRIKRVLRDFFQKELQNIIESRDVIIITLPGIESLEKEEINAKLKEIFIKMKLIV